MSKHKKTKKLTLEDVECELRCEEEDIPVKGNCSAIDEETDRKQEQWVYAQLRAGNEWAWCHVVVVGRYGGFEEMDSLGCCSYLSEEDFKQPGSYYDDMRNEVLHKLQKDVDDEIFREKQARQRLRAAKLLRVRIDMKMDGKQLAGAMHLGASALEDLAKKGIS